MDHHYPLLEAILVFLAAGIGGMTAASLLRFNPILGFFAAGALVGPYGFGLIENSPDFGLLAELGIAFLLFDIGSHTSFRSIWQQRKDLFGLGTAQVVTTAAAALLIPLWLGLPTGPALLVAAGLALSSTAVALQVLKDRNEQGGPLGQKAVSVLVFQDLFVVLLLVVIPALQGEGSNIPAEVGLAIGKTVVALVAVALMGRYLLQPVLRWITRQGNQELFTFAALGFVLVIAWGVSQLGLSLPLGAFLAGMSLAESRFSPLVQTEISPFRTLLLSLFFVSIGMSLQLGVLLERPLTVLALSLAMIVIKATALFGVLSLLGATRCFATRLASVLSQGSEFAFVLFGAAVPLGLLDAETFAVLGLSIGITMALTPVMASLGAAVGARIAKGMAEVTDAPQGADASAPKKIVVIGFDEFTQKVARVFSASGHPYVAMTDNRERVAEGISQGFKVEYGGPERPRALAMASAGEARAVVAAPASADIARRIVKKLRQIDPGLPIFLATDDLSLFHELSKLEVCDVVMKNDEAVAALARSALQAVGFEEVDVELALESANADEAEGLLAAIA